jgi:acyl-homoserine-lactone acylase
MKLEFIYSIHGPVTGLKGDRAYAVRIAGLRNNRIFEQFHRMSAATNIDEFQSALKMLQIQMFNIIYADRSGNIFYMFNGNVPKRKVGDFAFWRASVDGSKSDLVWNDIHPYEDLPKLLNPPTGFIQNCNDPPWTCTEPGILDPSEYPPYMAPFGTYLRPQRAVNMIKNNQSISFEQLIKYKHDTEMEAADRFLDDLLDAVEKYPSDTSILAAKVLRSWDKKTEATSRGAVLFAKWWDLMNNKMFEIPWDPKQPNTTPDGIREKKRAVELLEVAAKSVINKYGSMDIAWGDIYRLRYNGIDLPANGGPGDYGIFRTLYFTDDSDNKKHAIAGETYIAVIEFGQQVRAELLLSYGNATQPGNKHIGDQLKMLSEKKLRPALLERKTILQNLEKREILN